MTLQGMDDYIRDEEAEDEEPPCLRHECLYFGAQWEQEDPE